MANENNNKKTPNWQRRSTEEKGGKYLFNGGIRITKGVSETLSQAEIHYLLYLLFSFRDEKGEIDYLQVFDCTTKNDNRVVWFIDQLSKEMLEGGEYTEAQKKEYNYFTMLLPSEY